MIRTYKTGKLPIKLWCEPEDGAAQQLVNLSNLPFAFHHIAAMPDCHQGYGMPIGGVLATDGVIVPNAVGVDIGCGMIAVKTSLQEITREQITQIIGKAREVIPVGFKHHNEPQEINIDELLDGVMVGRDAPIVAEEIDAIKTQIGTLGGGNHFIEIQKGDDGYVWLMIHSGSRNLGKKICDSYNRIASDLNKLWCSSVPAQHDLAFLPLDSMFGARYITEMNIALKFAHANRDLMMARLINCVREFTGVQTFEDQINVHHNYAALENHFGKNVWVHRKGAIRMREGEIGIIPGSMGTPSYIVRGKGNKESFMSASHGAGRRMSRTEADKTFTEAEANKAIEGVVFGRWNKNRKGGLDLSECPLAYKDIDEVIANELDLVEPIVKLKPLGVMKG